MHALRRSPPHNVTDKGTLMISHPTLEALNLGCCVYQMLTDNVECLVSEILTVFRFVSVLSSVNQYSTMKLTQHAVWSIV